MGQVSTSAPCGGRMRYATSRKCGPTSPKGSPSALGEADDEPQQDRGARAKQEQSVPGGQGDGGKPPSTERSRKNCSENAQPSGHERHEHEQSAEPVRARRSRSRSFV